MEKRNVIKKFKIIRPGILILHPSGMIKDARSTVTLIQTEANNILIDTSREDDEKYIINALRQHDLKPDDINIIINTHCHKDHVENNSLFPSARIYMHCHGEKKEADVKIQEFPFHLEDNIEIIDTPGHSWDSIAILVKRRQVFAISGDAIPIRNNYLNGIIPFINVDRKKALESMKKIVKRADVIIPGHDFPIRIKKRINE
ncbi:MAG: MBL fold metallo-hydrolase [Candidatus Helarchaeota archaeon]